MSYVDQHEIGLTDFNQWNDVAEITQRLVEAAPSCVPDRRRKLPLIWCGIAEIQHHRASPCLGAVWCVDSACRTSPPLSSYGTMKQVCNPLINTVSSSDLSLESPLSSASSWYGMPAPFTACRLASSWYSTPAPPCLPSAWCCTSKTVGEKQRVDSPDEERRVTSAARASPPSPPISLGQEWMGKSDRGREERNGIAPRVCR